MMKIGRNSLDNDIIHVRSRGTKMKICSKCGAYNSDERNFCVDCGEKLGDKLSAVDEQQMCDNMDEKIEAMFNNNDPLYVSKSDKIFGLISLVGALCSLILIIIGKVTERSFDFLWFGIFFFLLAIIESFVPKLTWAFEKIRLSFTISDVDNAEPSEFYRVCRKVAIIISVAVGIAVLTINLLDFRHLPIRKYISEIASTESVGISSHTRDYINANTDKWEKIISEKDYAVKIFISELKEADSTGLEEQLMIEAIIEISGKENMTYTNKDDFLFAYNTYGW